jgi:hypothetical protein
MAKGDNQRGNREKKKPKADKKVVLVSPTFLRPDPNVGSKTGGSKPASK